jgi:hypothetical protein
MGDKSYYQYTPLEIGDDTTDDNPLQSLPNTPLSMSSKDSDAIQRSNSLLRSFHPFAATSKDNLAEEVEESSHTTPRPKSWQGSGKGKSKDEDDEEDDDDESPAKHNTQVLRKIGSIRRKDTTLSPYVVALYCMAFFCGVTLCYIIIVMTQSFSCEGAPYLYLTHQGSRNVMKFSRDGCLIHEKVLWGLTNSLKSNMRSMVLGTYQGKEALYVADSDEGKSGVMVFGGCLESTSLRPFITRIGGSLENPGAQHTYGIAIDYNGDMYASFQKTDAILRFSARQNFAPIENEPDLRAFLLKKYKNSTSSSNRYLRTTLQRDNHQTRRRRLQEYEYPELEKHKKGDPTADYVYFNGTFVQFGAPNWHNVSEQGIRSIQWVRNYTELWIANEDVNQVVIVDRRGHHIGSINVDSPIGLYQTANVPGIIFIGSKAKKIGAVYAVNTTSRGIVKTYQAIGMKHPTGITSYKDTLFVGDQTRNAVLTFNLTTARVIKMIIPSSKISGYVEQLTLSPC